MKPILLLACAALAAAQTAGEWPTGNRTTPPTINSVAPLGVARGATVEMTVEGFNLAKTGAVFFSEPGITARVLRVKELPDLPDIRLGSNGTLSTVDLGPLPPRNQVTLELEISPEAAVGPVGFRLQTPLGTSPEARFVIEPYYGESPDREPNDTPDNAFESYLPTILVGTIGRPGDADFYKIKAEAGQQLVFENAAPSLGSALQPVVSILDAGQNVIREFGREGGLQAEAFSHRFDKAGEYYIRVADFQQGGSPGHFYRIKVGKLPLVSSAYPLGVARGQTAAVSLTGYNVASQIQVKGVPSEEDPRAVFVRPAAFNRVKLALGAEPEVEATPGGAIPVPVTVNGRILKGPQSFRFHARKGEQLVVEVNAARLGSRLDSIVEVLDSGGNPIERATVRCVLETSTTLSERDSSSPGIRITSPAGFAVNDWVMIGGEIVRVLALPRTPDDDFVFQSFGGQRLAWFDTSTEAHAIDKPVYKVQIHPPGTRFASNGLPVVSLYYRNDDGGPGFGKDSLLHFTAPADGEYQVRIADVRGQGGEDYAYRLTVRRPAPDFLLSVSPRNPNVPQGGSIPITVTALRLDGLASPIQVSVVDLPAGFHSTTGSIAPGQVSTTLLLSAEESAKLDRAAPLRVVGRAGAITRWANPEDKLKLLALMPKPDIQMHAETREVLLEPGGQAEVQVSIRRNNEFAGRVPVEVRNLPPGVLVLDVGLNGVLINETENRRGFVLRALPFAEPIEQAIYVSGKIETRADAQQTSYAGEPILLKIRPRTAGGTSGVPAPVARASATR